MRRKRSSHHHSNIIPLIQESDSDHFEPQGDSVFFFQLHQYIYFLSNAELFSHEQENKEETSSSQGEHIFHMLEIIDYSPNIA